mmetsp:Transcript_56733/g.139216  ORF Transcript_56733/g.139216 Transcript_56733/m.139216 type:complete len:123 (+) Transcript_56733:1-369(+)
MADDAAASRPPEAAAASPPPKAVSPPAKAPGDKVIILANNVGNAPILSQKQFSCSGSSSVSRIQTHIQTKIRSAPNHANATVHIFINKSFCPAPDEILSDLFKCFQTDGKLVVDYALMEAWG